jgi:hypothetical protein
MPSGQNRVGKFETQIRVSAGTVVDANMDVSRLVHCPRFPRQLATEDVDLRLDFVDTDAFTLPGHDAHTGDTAEIFRPGHAALQRQPEIRRHIDIRAIEHARSHSNDSHLVKHDSQGVHE